MAGTLRKSPPAHPGRSPAKKERVLPRPMNAVLILYPNSFYDRVDQNHQTRLNIAAKKIPTPMTSERFTLVVRLCTFTSGRPELSFSIDMRNRRHGPDWAPVVPGSRSNASEPVKLLGPRRGRDATEMETFLIFESVGGASRCEESNDRAANQCGNSKEHDDDDRDGRHVHRPTSSQYWNCVSCCPVVPPQTPAGIKAGRITPTQPHAAIIGARPPRHRLKASEGRIEPAPKKSIRQRL